jgi:hypothetical protein
MHGRWEERVDIGFFFASTAGYPSFDCKEMLTCPPMEITKNMSYHKMKTCLLMISDMPKNRE